MAASDVIRGRQTATRTLTNKSGGTVNLGDAVRIYDGSNDNSFTTTTTAAYNAGPVGVVMETIANNAAGLVAIGGYVPLINSNSASLTRGRFLFTHTVAKTVTASATRAAGAFGYILETGTNPEAIIFPMPDASAASGDNPIIWTAGTSMPGSPSTNDRITRTDLGMDFYYDGTRWLCTCPHVQHLGNFSSAAASTTAYTAIETDGTQDIWAETLYGTFQAASGLSGSAYWRADLYFVDGATLGSVIASQNDQSGTNATNERKKTAIGALVGTAMDAYLLDLVKVSTPGNFFGGFKMRYRYVGT